VKLHAVDRIDNLFYACSMRAVFILFLVVFFLNISSYGSEKSGEPIGGVYLWFAPVLGGNYDLNLSSSTSTPYHSYGFPWGLGYNAGAEVDFYLSKWLGISVPFGFSGFSYDNYNYSDFIFTMGVSPKPRYKFSFFTTWVQFVVGFSMKPTKMDGDFETIDGMNLYHGDVSGIGLYLSPRIGIDFDIYGRLKVGFHFACHYSENRYEMTHRNTISGVPNTVSILQRGLWYALGFRLGITFASFGDLFE